MLCTMEKLSKEKLTAFCAALASTGMVRKACDAVGISMQTAFRWRKDIPQFADMWDEASNVGTTLAEDEAWRRAVDGVDKPVYYKGERIDTIKEHSDTLLVTILRARKPDVYRDNSRLELAGKLELSSMTDDDLRAELAALTHPDKRDDHDCDLV